MHGCTPFAHPKRCVKVGSTSSWAVESHRVFPSPFHSSLPVFVVAPCLRTRLGKAGVLHDRFIDLSWAVGGNTSGRSNISLAEDPRIASVRVSASIACRTGICGRRRNPCRDCFHPRYYLLVRKGVLFHSRRRGTRMYGVPTRRGDGFFARLSWYCTRWRAALRQRPVWP
jgi:hypothetical protein